MKTLVIATDFSANARHAASYGYQLAEQLRADIVLCNAMIIPAEIPQAGVVVWPYSEMDALMRDSKSALIRSKLELEQHETVHDFKPAVRLVNCAGSVTMVIRELAQQQPTEMIVMGTHSPDELGTLLIGDHCRKMIDCLDQPLLLVPPTAKTVPARRLAFASDFSDPIGDMRAIKALTVIARQMGAALILTHIDNDTNVSADHIPCVKQLLLEFIKLADYTAIDYRVITNHHVEHGLDQLIRQERIDILAMVHHEHDFIYELLHGRHSRRMAKRADIPLLIFKGKR